MKNQINNKTFALRLKSFIRKIQVNDLMSIEEKEYFCMIADKILLYQDEQERINYLKITIYE